MKILFQFHFLPTLAIVVLSLGFQLNAQQSSTTHQDDPQQQQPQAQPPSQSTSPDAHSQNPPQPADANVFTGTIVKSGDRFMLKESDTGKMYDIDRQDLAGKHEGKEVRVPGTLDADGKTIHVNAPPPQPQQ
ncbi:MAG TPA: DUF5818 domain-containing protein [Terriglobales bacterium]